MTTTAPHAGTATLLRLLLITAALLGTVLTGTADAHAALTGSNPKDGAVLAVAPKDVTLTFSEQVALGNDSIRVLDPRSRRVDTAELKSPGGEGAVSYGVGLESGLPDGTYTVAWQAVSADSHPIAGAFTFSIGAPSKTVVELPKQQAGGGLVGVLYGIARYAAYAGFTVMVGGAAFVLACWPRGAGTRAVQRVVAYGWVTLTAATVAMLLLRNPYTGSGRLGDAFDLAGLQAVLATKTGAALVSRLLLLGVAALFVAVLFGAYAKQAPRAERATRPAAGDAGGTSVPRTPGEPAAGGTGGIGGTGRTRGTGDTAGTEGTEGAERAERAERAQRAGSTGEPARPGTAATAGAAAADEGGRRAPGDRIGQKQDLALGLGIGGTVVAAGIACTWALSEHASTGIQPGVAMPVDVLHLLAVAAWLGGLTALLVALHRAPSIERAAVRRFSRVAFWSVVVLAATGLYQSWRQVGSWSALAGTSYGRLLLVKVGLVAVLVGIAWISRRWTARLSGRAPAAAEAGATGTRAAEMAAPAGAGLPQTGPAEAATPAGANSAGRGAAEAAATSGDPVRAAQLARQEAAMAAAGRKRLRDADPERSGLRRSVLAEAGVAVVLLAVTTALTSTEPGRAEERAAQERGARPSAAAPAKPVDITLPFDTGGPNGDGTARLTVSPGRSGANELRLWTTGPDNRPLDAPEVKVSFTLVAEKIGPLPLVPERVAAGHWSASNIQIPLPGEWRVRITVRTSDIDQTTVEKNMRIG
ncbi:copper resistance CopC/CopD family protein [Streptomyces pacificus]|uniref:Copper resistance protein CopC/CopD n=1 Tax=Streptomyces pacificus TaxID=2705029 RepID=A0A6A0B0Q8_9ACTN|nr:copper resistance protein CopC [Streptomyces pacificus]GFH38706.1 copper resistance protein CopC/CopD [Streptomyces pacificus]